MPMDHKPCGEGFLVVTSLSACESTSAPTSSSRGIVSTTSRGKPTLSASFAKFIRVGAIGSYPKATSMPYCEEHLGDGYPVGTNAPI